MSFYAQSPLLHRSCHVNFFRIIPLLSAKTDRIQNISRAKHVLPDTLEGRNAMMDFYTDTQDDGSLLLQQAEALTEDERLVLPNLANTAALLGESLPDINWAGYYLRSEDTLILGPFWGRPACIRIPLGKGVCGTAAAEDRVLCVPDVHAFAGHIACDSRSRSEIVIPIHADGKVVGVLDIDSPSLSRFTAADAELLQAFACILEKNCDWR
jgi:GAF domain-containing protein